MGAGVVATASEEGYGVESSGSGEGIVVERRVTRGGGEYGDDVYERDETRAISKRTMGMGRLDTHREIPCLSEKLQQL